MSEVADVVRIEKHLKQNIIVNVRAVEIGPMRNPDIKKQDNQEYQISMVENHVEENHVDENHVDENHVEENHVAENHVEENKPIISQYNLFTPLKI